MIGSPVSEEGDQTQQLWDFCSKCAEFRKFTENFHHGRGNELCTRSNGSYVRCVWKLCAKYFHLSRPTSVTSSLELQEAESETAHLMSFTLAFHIDGNELTGQ